MLLVFIEEIAFKHFLFTNNTNQSSFYFPQTLKSENWKSFKDYDVT